jgi:hypothetical protein
MNDATDVFDFGECDSQVTKQSATVDETNATKENQKIPKDKPLLGDLLTANKTIPAEGNGPGDRPWVFSEGGLRRPRQGDQTRPICPLCSTDELAVLTGATTSPTAGQTATTRYKCPRCTFSTQKLRPGMAEMFKRRATEKPAEPFVKRP